jgi:hypothetical protein
MTAKRVLYERRDRRHVVGTGEVKKTDFAPTVEGDYLVVHDRTSDPRGSAGRPPLTVSSTIHVIDVDLVVVLVEGWQYRTPLGGAYAFVHRPDTGWRRVTMSPRVKARVRSSERPGAEAVRGYLAREAAYGLARAERAAGITSYVDPDTGAVEHFEDEDLDAVAGLVFTSQARLVRALLDARVARLAAEVEAPGGNVVAFPAVGR